MGNRKKNAIRRACHCQLYSWREPLVFELTIHGCALSEIDANVTCTPISYLLIVETMSLSFNGDGDDDGDGDGDGELVGAIVLVVVTGSSNGCSCARSQSPRRNQLRAKPSIKLYKRNLPLF